LFLAFCFVPWLYGLGTAPIVAGKAALRKLIGKEEGNSNGKAGVTVISHRAASVIVKKIN